MDENYVTYVDDEHVDNHGYDDKTDDDHYNNDDIYARACNARVNKSIHIYIYIYIYYYYYYIYILIYSYSFTFRYFSIFIDIYI